MLLRMRHCAAEKCERAVLGYRSGRRLPLRAARWATVEASVWLRLRMKKARK